MADSSSGPRSRVGTLAVRGLALAGAAALTAAAMMALAYFHPRGSREAVEPAWIARRLEALGDSALASRDVPVAALLLLGDSVIGSGYNTVVRDGNVAGHAEINAISAALQGLGARRFGHLHRDSLVLVTTFEPCVMCRGAIVHHGIRKVRILKRKPALELVREDLRLVRLLWRRAFTGPPSLQDSLFRLHPDYPGE